MRPHNLPFKPCLIAVAVAAAVTSPVHATDYTWTGGSGSWITTNLWDPTGFPNSFADNVAIDRGQTGRLCNPFSVNFCGGGHDVGVTG